MRNPNYQVFCHVCKMMIGFYGFPNHVKKHKKELGNNIYLVMKIRRDIDNGKAKKLPERRQLTL